MDPGTIAISGSTGLVGRALIAGLSGARVLRLARAGSRLDEGVLWDPASGSFDAARLEGCDAVVHLAGEPIAAGRWSARVKERIRASRVDGTRLLVDGLKRLSKPPGVLVCASAVGFYGDRGDETLDESSPPGTGFLAETCQAWEAEAQRAAGPGLRVVNLRTGIVLAAHGGALAKMLLPFKLGAGGRLGDGRQWMSWVHLQDLVAIIRFALSTRELSGPANAVSPQPVRNDDFTRALARVLRRPAILPAPRFALRLAMGEMADALLLSSQRVEPRRLADLGFTFGHPRLEEALEELLRRG